jgi:peptidyl-prolyl cis-trans isomerase D
MAQTTRNLSNRIHDAFSEKFNFKTILALVVFGMIIIVFSFSSMNGPQSGQLGNGVAATVNGEIISRKQFAEQENRISQYYSQMLGGQFDNLIQRQNLRNEALNQLVDNSVAAQAAEKEMIVATDSNVRNAILEMPYFKKDGVFQSDVYKGVLATNGMNAGEFEKMMRQQISIQKVRDLFEASTVATDLEKNVEADLKKAKMNLAYLKIDAELVNSLGGVSDAKIKEALAKDDFKKKVTDYIKSRSSEFSTPEQVKASHILVKADDKNAADVEKARLKAEQILAELKKADFGVLAKKYSDDPGSKEKSGDLGFFSKGSMVKEFEDTAFSLEKGKVSGLVKTQFGFHIIKVMDKKPATTKSEAESEMIAGRKLFVDDQTVAIAKQLEEKVSKGISSTELNSYLSQNNYKMKETGLFDIANETVPAINSTEVFKAALELTKEKPVASKIVKDGEAQYLVMLKDSVFDQSSPVLNAPESQNRQMAEKQKAYAQYQNWLEANKKSYKIDKNEALLTAE